MLRHPVAQKDVFQRVPLEEGSRIYNYSRRQPRFTPLDDATALKVTQVVTT